MRYIDTIPYQTVTQLMPESIITHGAEHVGPATELRNCHCLIGTFATWDSHKISADDCFTRGWDVCRTNDEIHVDASKNGNTHQWLQSTIVAVL
jgi:hypothetical protein